MSTNSIPYLPAAVEKRRKTFLTERYAVFSWLLTRDHKRIAILYMISITGFFFIGGMAAMLMRLNLLTPNSDLVNPEWYNRLFTLHGVVMVLVFHDPVDPHDARAIFSFR